VTSGPPQAHIPGRAGAYPIPPPPPRERRWIPPIVLFLVILFVAFGGYFVAAGVGLEERSGTTPRVSVGGIRFAPEPGWVVVRDVPGTTPGVQLTRGSGNLLVLVLPDETDPAGALEAYVEGVLRPEAMELQLAEEVEEVPMPDGTIALRRFYVGTFADNPGPLEGNVTAFVLPGGPAVVFDGWAGEGSYREFAPEVHAMARTAETA
jgi:hypothetical protein